MSAGERRRRRVQLVGDRGPTLNAREQEVVAKRLGPEVAVMPSSVRSIRYDALTGVTTVKLATVVTPAGPVDTVWAMTPTELRAVYQALGRCVEESTRVVLDVDAT